jgi:hypothetical protein
MCTVVGPIVGRTTIDGKQERAGEARRRVGNRIRTVLGGVTGFAVYQMPLYQISRYIKRAELPLCIAVPCEWSLLYHFTLYQMEN